MRAFNIIEHPTLGGESASRKDYFAVLGIASAAATIATTVVALRVNGTPIAAVIDAYVRTPSRLSPEPDSRRPALSAATRQPVRLRRQPHPALVAEHRTESVGPLRHPRTSAPERTARGTTTNHTPPPRPPPSCLLTAERPYTPTAARHPPFAAICIIGDIYSIFDLEARV
ncbi:hypothetical protein EVJ58_g10335 [Rhodofomes roseus]|uniref:Uncharacterized protein n=1 Tax=Rhodofomes roseus TaxID=34475 RepID=A0A4Y9XNG8_9APHY|nr:hypothetical protein EVJ58_g10335 [Rhodofomes roseus]